MRSIRPTSWTALVLVLACLSGCGYGPLVPAVDADVAAIALGFEAHALPWGAPADSAATTGGSSAGEIVIGASLTTGSSGFELVPSLFVQGGVLHLRIDAREGMGVTVPARYRYTARLSGLAPGNQRLRVLHKLYGRHTLVVDEVFRVD